MPARIVGLVFWNDDFLPPLGSVTTALFRVGLIQRGFREAKFGTASLKVRDVTFMGRKIYCKRRRGRISTFGNHVRFKPLIKVAKGDLYLFYSFRTIA